MSERAYCKKVQSMMSICKSPRANAGSLAGSVWFATVWLGLVRSEDQTGRTMWTIMMMVVEDIGRQGGDGIVVQNLTRPD